MRDYIEGVNLQSEMRRYCDPGSLTRVMYWFWNCSASSLMLLQPVISQGFKNEEGRKMHGFVVFIFWPPNNIQHPRIPRFSSRAASIQTRRTGKFCQKCLAKSRLIPQPISKYPFYNFQFFCFREHEIEPTQRKVENTLPLIFHFSKPIFYFCMKNSPVDNIRTNNLLRW